jgi:eukaryotic-like serine/threonine-protein kinase
MTSPDHQYELALCVAVMEQQLAGFAELAPVLRHWLDDPRESLSQRLVAQGLLAEAQVVQLESSVAARLGHDPWATSQWDSAVKQLQGDLSVGLPTRAASLSGSSSDRDQESDHTSAIPAPLSGGKHEERFQIVSSYAEGALGEVFVAHDQQVGRMVALKQIKSRWADIPDSRARFLLEAQVTGRLEHPGIVPVYALGFDPSGRPYYAMRFIEGEGLSEVVKRFHGKFKSANADRRERILELRKLLGRLVTVCQTIDYAHSRGIIHRDLKPANIMLGKYGETLVVDWGLAKVLGGTSQWTIPSAFQGIAAGAPDGTLTVGGAAIGTPAYMSPEQAAGKVHELTPQTDIYSLGVTLYHLLTGRLPHEEGSVSGVLEQVQLSDLVPPRRHCPWLPAALEAICLKAMASRPEERYTSAAALADELERWLADEPVVAHSTTWHERLRMWVRRRW